MAERKAIVAITDGGGRGAVLAQHYLKSPHVEKVLAFPGNDMMEEAGHGKVLTFKKIKPSYYRQIVDVALDNGATHIDVCQDNAVQAGVADQAIREGLKVIGPTKSAGRIEWDKEYARRLADRVGILQPRWAAFSTADQVQNWLTKDRFSRHLFVKAVGLAEGKGSISTRSDKEILEAVERLKREHPKAANRFLIEEAIEGVETSNFAISDGENVKYIGSAQDHKHEFDGDSGEMTGGMGAVLNPTIMNDYNLLTATKSNFKKIVDAQRLMGAPYKGWLFEGAMAVKSRNYYQHLLEWNARLGDPEAQVIIPSLDVDLLELGDAMANGDISSLDVKMDGLSRTVITVASIGYPRDYSSVLNKEIKSLAKLKKMHDISIYGAGVNIVDGKPTIAGGRLFYIAASGINALQSRTKLDPALDLIREMDGENIRFREDIGKKEIDRLFNNRV